MICEVTGDNVPYHQTTKTTDGKTVEWGVYRDACAYFKDGQLAYNDVLDYISLMLHLDGMEEEYILFIKAVIELTGVDTMIILKGISNLTEEYTIKSWGKYYNVCTPLQRKGILPIVMPPLICHYYKLDMVEVRDKAERLDAEIRGSWKDFIKANYSKLSPLSSPRMLTHKQLDREMARVKRYQMQ